ncbi:unnamed protein product [Discosporangium mesarthrocarpum]
MTPGPAGWTVWVSRAGRLSAGDGLSPPDQAVSPGDRGMRLYNLPQGAQLEIRKRRDGDVFWPEWRENPIKMKDFLRGQGVPLHLRDEVALVCHEDKVVAVYPRHPGAGFGSDETGADPVDVFVAGTRLHLLPPRYSGKN